MGMSDDQNLNLARLLMGELRQPEPDALARGMGARGGFWDTYIRPWGSASLGQQPPWALESGAPISNRTSQASPQNLDALSNGLDPQAALPWSRNVLGGAQRVSDELRWALGYPSRVWNRAFPAEVQEMRVGFGYGLPLHGEVSLENILGQHKYVPSGRESENVEDRRPKSIWQYR